MNSDKDLFEHVVGVSASQLKDTLEVVTRLALALVAIAYIVGFFIINVHLRSYGLTGLGLARAEYVMAGVLWLALLVATYAAFAVARWTMVASRASGHLYGARRQFAALFLGVVGTYAVFSFPIGFATGNLLAPWNSRTAFGGVVIALQPAALFLLFRTIDRARTHRQAPDLTDPGNHPARNTVVACFIVLGGVLLYSEIAYPLFLPTYGGGRPTSIRLDLTETALARTIPADSQWFLIAETEKWLAVTNEDPTDRLPFAPRRALRVKSDAVLSITSARP